ncbi:hypothetical protein VTK56DRAFT_6688 [Thermocarpiscus australiensis]
MHGDARPCDEDTILRPRDSMPGLNAVARGAHSKACHNCRRRRLRCDRSRPSCRKCWSTGEACLGYGTVLRWANAPAVRGKLAGQLATTAKDLRADPASTNSAPAPVPSRFSVRFSIAPSLLDPLLSGMHKKERQYLIHFATAVCQDLVSIDQHDRNPFRAIVPLAAEFSFLQPIIVATGAMHLVALHGWQDQPGRPELIDALVAKDKAIRLLQSAVDAVTPENQAMVLAATVFFINLDLIDSGKGSWQAHIEAASALMSTLHGPIHALSYSESAVSLVDAIVADCFTYIVLGSAISGVAMASGARHNLADLFAVLKRAEAFSYHCCPPEILQIILAASHLCNNEDTTNVKGHARVEMALSLLRQARFLDVVEWVHSIRGLSEQDDLSARVSLASAHRATACLYILLAVPEAATDPSMLDTLVHEVLGHLSAVPADHVLLKGTVWPTFMAGAQTDDPVQRAWCIDRMQAVWTKNPWVCPWGYIGSAIQMLRDLWERRDQEFAEGRKANWLQELKSMRDKCLIV